jgi:hypothetical protein
MQQHKMATASGGVPQIGAGEFSSDRRIVQLQQPKESQFDRGLVTQKISEREKNNKRKNHIKGRKSRGKRKKVEKKTDTEGEKAGGIKTRGETRQEKEKRERGSAGGEKGER